MKVGAGIQMILSILTFTIQQLQPFILDNKPFEIVYNFLSTTEITIAFGSQKKETKFCFNQEIPHSWVMHTFYTPLDSNASLFIRKEANGSVYSDDFDFVENDISIKGFHYLLSNYLLETYSYHKTAGFGLSYGYHDTNWSLIHHLYYNGYISQLSYSFLNNEKSNTSFIMFGGIPDSIRTNKQRGLCHVNPNDIKWSIKLKEINVKGYTYVNNYNAYFQIGIEKIYAPQHFIDYLIDVVYQHDILSGRCRPFGRRHVSCSYYYVIQLPNITFSIDDYVYSFSPAELFQKTRGISDPLIILNPFDENGWVIGNTFLKRFDSLFDIDKGVVELFSDENKIQKYINAYILLKRWCCFGVCLLSLIGLLIFFCLRLMNNKINVLQ